MVWSRGGDAERPPLSEILPRLYLGAESDVTQETLASRGISFVLSVSRSTPQPSFLPGCRYLRIPIDDSLWADLLPWIPQALRFIDAAMSSGGAVLVHCAAGISRSPALAVAYVMYSLDLDLDHAYRFVKERRPTISPNFNFLGQLQHFQAALSQKTPGGGLSSRPLGGPPAQIRPDGGPEADAVTVASPPHTDATQQRLAPSDGGGERRPPHTLRLTLNLREVASPGASGPPPPPARDELRPGSESLRDKRRSLTLSLSPVVTAPPSGTPCAAHTPPRRLETGAEPETTPPSSRTRGGKELLSPFSITLNKLLDWGEKVLLGGAFIHPVRMGRPALPYRC